MIESRRHNPRYSGGAARTRRTDRGAFTLIEVLIAIVLLGVFSLLATRLTITALDLIAQPKREGGVIRVFDRAMDRLRTDVWGADDVVVTNEHTLLVRLSDNRSALWLMNDDVLERAESIGHQVQGSVSYALGGRRLRFASAGGQIAVHQPVRDDQPERTAWMTPQKRVLRSLQR